MSSFRLRVQAIVLFLTAAGCLVAPVLSQTSQRRANGAVVALGEKLFNDTRLSTSGTTSCASCHRPDRSFTEGKQRAVGQEGTVLGRNTPTLLGLATVNEFPVGGSFQQPPKMVPLEDRVVEPLREVAEMGGSVADALKRLSKDPSSGETFDGAFDADEETPRQHGVTGDRVAMALAAYIRSLDAARGPGLAALAGSEASLDEEARRGLELFREGGRCQSCHRGPGLTDGKLHIVSRVRVQRFRNQGLPTAKGKGTEKQPPNAGPGADEGAPTRGGKSSEHRPGGPWGPEGSVEIQTLPLVHVSRTGPYFRDGSAPTLAEAVRQHVNELRDIGATRASILEHPARLSPTGVLGKSAAPPAFSASVKEQLSSDDWIPPKLTPRDRSALVAFLVSLSPRN